ncbi:hypothetical protein [Aneurinibacillus thermoaerophilus]|uniref:hypothetical protein n=1 Tax=Aneurinibacillus thermoaerophilus TaxID=143495 RepID=UPI002E20BDE2|nr:hypothetical protein [Aneurinibacillus thermoaerophilus]
MFLHPSLFHASSTTEWSGQRIEFHFHLTRIAAWNGIIPLTPTEIAAEIGCTSEAVRRYIVQAIDDQIIEETAAGKLRLLTFIEKADENEKQTHYVRHFPFFYSQDFRNLSVAAKRFLLHCLANGAYWKATGYERKLKDMYHSYHRIGGGKRIYKRGLFNIYQRKQMLDIIDEVRPFLDITIRNEGTQKEVIRVIARSNYFPNDKETVVKNVGKHIWVKKKLDKHGYILSSVHEKSVNNLVAIMNDYVNRLSFEDASELFEESLSQLSHSLSFLDALSREDMEQDVYRIFYSVMKQNEEKYVEQLSIQYEMLSDKSGAKKKAFFAGRNSIQEKLAALDEKLNTFKAYWKKRFETPKDPFWKLRYDYGQLVKKRSIFILMEDLYNEYLNQARKIWEELRALKDKPFVPYNWLEQAD